MKAAVLAAAMAVVMAACGSSGDTSPATTSPATTSPGSTSPDTTLAPDASGPLVVYSGRGEDLVGPIIERFTEATGIEVSVRYGNSAEMLLLIQEEGRNSPADLYYSQGAGFLGILSADNGLRSLPVDLLDLVPDGLRSPNGDWLGLSGRARVIVYNTDKLSADQVPASLTELSDPVWKGRIGWAPTNASLQDHVTALRGMLGEQATEEWLRGVMANAVPYTNNGAILDAVAAGEVEIGLTNHYYLYPRLRDNPSYPVANKFSDPDDPGALVNIAGAGVLATSSRPQAATELLRFLLSTEAQEYFSGSNFEIPTVVGVSPAEGVPAIDAVVVPRFDLNQLTDLQGTVDLLIKVGAL
jgi:iron(III) transport system substrate-binding protein